MAHQITSRGSHDWESPHLQIILRGKQNFPNLLQAGFLVAKQLSKKLFSMNYALLSKGRSPEKKTAVLLDFVQMSWAEGRALPKFFVTFSRGAFLVNKGAYFFQNANNLIFKLFF